MPTRTTATASPNGIGLYRPGCSATQVVSHDHRAGTRLHVSRVLQRRLAKARDRLLTRSSRASFGADAAGHRGDEMTAGVLQTAGDLEARAAVGADNAREADALVEGDFGYGPRSST